MNQSQALIPPNVLKFAKDIIPQIKNNNTLLGFILS
jgi:hypothetical protein